MSGLFTLADSDKRFSTRVPGEKNRTEQNETKTKQRCYEFKVAINYTASKVTANDQNNSFKTSSVRYTTHESRFMNTIKLDKSLKQ